MRQVREVLRLRTARVGLNEIAGLSSFFSPRFMPGSGRSRPISLRFWTIVVCGRKRSAWCWPLARRCGWRRDRQRAV
jgi:hypothetical protein